MIGSRSPGSDGKSAARGVAGFTLVELMVTVAVLAIVGAIAAPAFSRMISHNRVVSGGNEVIAALQTARAEAIARRAVTTFCASSDGSGCSGSTGSRWIVLSTKNGVSTVVRSAAVSPALRVVLSPNVVSANAQIVFTPAGFIQVGARNSGTISLCASDLSDGNAFDISANVVRIASARRSAGPDCSAPGDI